MLTKIFAGKAKGEFMAPPSKSMAHRYLICSALADGKGTIDNVSYSNDIHATIDCLKSMGVEISVRRRKASVDNKGSFNSNCTLECRESGSTLRFLIPIYLALGIEATFKGSERLFSRPLDVYEKIYAALEAEKPARSVELDADETEFTRDLQLITLKPVLYCCNIK